jgi:hypothetical protein
MPPMSPGTQRAERTPTETPTKQSQTGATHQESPSNVGCLNDVLSKLPLLSLTDLDRVRQKIGMLRSVSGNSAPLQGATSGGDAVLVLEAIAGVLGGVGVEHCSVTMLQKSPQYSSFARKIPVLMQYMNGLNTRNEKRAFLCEAVRLLYEDLCGMNIAVSARTVMAHAHRIPAVVNKAFPGYAQGGFLAMVVRKSMHD